MSQAGLSLKHGGTEDVSGIVANNSSRRFLALTRWIHSFAKELVRWAMVGRVAPLSHTVDSPLLAALLYFSSLFRAVARDAALDSSPTRANFSWQVQISTAHFAAQEQSHRRWVLPSLVHRETEFYSTLTVTPLHSDFQIKRTRDRLFFFFKSSAQQQKKQFRFLS